MRAYANLIAGRAWSRAGAIAAILASGVPRRVLALSTRLALLLAGSIGIGVAVALMLWNDIGPGPLDVFIGAVRARTGLPLMLAVWTTVGVLTLVAWVLGRRPGVGTIVGPVIVGPTMQFGQSLLGRFDQPSGLAAHLVVHLLAIGIIGLGAGAMIVSGLGAGTGELLASAASDRTGRPEPWVRLGFESTWLVLGIVLGGPIGFGTVLVTLTIGPSVARGYRWVDAAAARSRHSLAVAVR